MEVPTLLRGEAKNREVKLPLICGSLRIAVFARMFNGNFNGSELMDCLKKIKTLNRKGHSKVTKRIRLRMTCGLRKGRK